MKTKLFLLLLTVFTISSNAQTFDWETAILYGNTQSPDASASQNINGQYFANFATPNQTPILLTTAGQGTTGLSVRNQQLETSVTIGVNNATGQGINIESIKVFEISNNQNWTFNSLDESGNVVNTATANVSQNASVVTLKWTNVVQIEITRTNGSSSNFGVDDIVFTPYLPPNTVVYVNANATGNNDGTTWANAFTKLEDALAIVNDDNEIWVAQGTYLPNTSGSKTSPFNINRANLKIYGGFVGSETQISDRVLGHNETILSGDFQASDVFVNDHFVNSYHHSSKTDNSYNVINITADGNNLVLDGLTISNAHNNTNTSGASIIKEKTVSKLSLKNCIIKNNISYIGGAGVLAEFDLNNTSGPRGELNIENCKFINNMSRYASSIYSFAQANTNIDITVENTLFDNNISGNLGVTLQGLSGAGSWFRSLGTNADVTVKLINNAYVNNIDDSKGNSLDDNSRATVAINKTAGTLNAEVVNCIFWNNYRPTSVGEISTRSITNTYQDAVQSITVKNSIDQLNFNDASITSKTNTSNSNPLFISETNVTLQSGSPAIDSGDNLYVNTSLDLLGNQRIFNTTVDMGVYEYGSTVLSNTDFVLNANDVKVYPNPTASVLNIKMNTNLKQATVYSVLGEKIFQTQSNIIKTANLKRGMYLIIIENESGVLITKRFIKN